MPIILSCFSQNEAYLLSAIILHVLAANWCSRSKDVGQLTKLICQN